MVGGVEMAGIGWGFWTVSDFREFLAYEIWIWLFNFADLKS